ELNPSMAEANLMTALTVLNANRFDDAITAFQNGPRGDPKNADLHFNLGTVYDKMGRFDEVVQEMEEAITLNPAHADALNYLGYSHAERDVQLNAAVKLIRQALTLTPQ